MAIPGYSYKTEDRDRLVEKFLPLVNRIANRLAMGLPSHIDRGDLVGSGVLGLLDAIERYDATKGPLKNYVALRIRGAMLDDLRKMSWLPRNLLQKSREIEAAYNLLRARLLREPGDNELAEELGIDPAELSRLLAYINQKSVVSVEEYLFPGTGGEKKVEERLADDDPDSNPEESLLKKEQTDKLAAALASLSEREQLILHLYYREELTLREIGRVLDIGESRVCQLHGRAMLKLRARMGGR
jgi:RNA polymerase sigma factor for flagellar operon FliA